MKKEGVSNEVSICNIIPHMLGRKDWIMDTFLMNIGKRRYIYMPPIWDCARCDDQNC